MKALIISLALVLNMGFSEFFIENNSDGRFKILELDSGEKKYLDYNEKEKAIKILNTDHSVWKTVELPLPKGHFLDEVKLVSTNIFNDDYLVEVLYTSLVYDYSFNNENPSENSNYISKTLNVINEKGEVLLKEEKIDDYTITEMNDSKKLFVYKNVNHGFNKKSETLVYDFQD